MEDRLVFLGSKFIKLTRHGKLFGLIICLSFVFLCAFPLGYAQAEEKLPDKIYLPFKPVFPFKAKTTDECIHERECAWYYFIKFQERFSDEAKKEYGDKLSEDDKNSVIKKWKKPIHLLVLPQPVNNDFRQELEMALARVKDCFPYDIKITNDQVNSVLLFTDDFKRDLFGPYKSIFSQMFGSYLFNEYNKFEITQPIITSGSFLIDKERLIVGTSIFMAPDKGIVSNVIESKIFYNLGFTGLSFSTPYFPADNHYKMTDLHFFLLRMLYHPDMKEGIRLSDSQVIFNRIYLGVLKSFDAYNADKERAK